MFNSFNSHIIARYHAQLLERLDAGQHPAELISELWMLLKAEHLIENRIHDQAVFRLDPHSFD